MCRRTPLKRQCVHPAIHKAFNCVLAKCAAFKGHIIANFRWLMLLEDKRSKKNVNLERKCWSCLLKSTFNIQVRKMQRNSLLVSLLSHIPMGFPFPRNAYISKYAQRAQNQLHWNVFQMYNFSIAYIFENEISWNNFIFYILPKFRKLDTWLNGKSIDGQTYS